MYVINIVLRIGNTFFVFFGLYVVVNACTFYYIFCAMIGKDLDALRVEMIKDGLSKDEIVRY